MLCNRQEPRFATAGRVVASAGEKSGAALGRRTDAPGGGDREHRGEASASRAEDVRDNKGKGARPFFPHLSLLSLDSVRARGHESGKHSRRSAMFALRHEQPAADMEEKGERKRKRGSGGVGKR